MGGRTEGTGRLAAADRGLAMLAWVVGSVYGLGFGTVCLLAAWMPEPARFPDAVLYAAGAGLLVLGGLCWSRAFRRRDAAGS